MLPEVGVGRLEVAENTRFCVERDERWRVTRGPVTTANAILCLEVAEGAGLQSSHHRKEEL